MASKPVREDVILPMTDDYMQQIVRKEKNHEFRKYRIAASVKRIWFYLNAPFSHIAYICEIDPACTRNPGDDPLTEDGLGNKEFNKRHADWKGYDFAYRIRSVYRLEEPISLVAMKEKFSIKSAPRSRVYTPETILRANLWDKQQCVWRDHASATEVSVSSASKRKRDPSEKEPVEGKPRSR